MFLSPLRHAWCIGVCVIALLTAASFGHAQVQAPGTGYRTERADPLDAQVRVPAAVHVSAFASYRRLGDDKRVDWKEANEAVNRIGGWRTYLREAQQPDPAPTAPTSRPAPAPGPGPAPAPAPSSGAVPAHGGHKTH